jgi:DNA-binding response OmpR family regulator
MSTMNALVLEDNPRITKLYEKILSTVGFDVDFVSDNFSCLDKFLNEVKNYNFVILEKSTKFNERIKLEDKILSIKPQQKIFFLSPYLTARGSEFDNISETMSLIDKPFAMVSLLSYLEINAPVISQ